MPRFEVYIALDLSLKEDICLFKNANAKHGPNSRLRRYLAYSRTVSQCAGDTISEAKAHPYGPSCPRLTVRYRSSNKKNLSKKEATERFLFLFRDEASRLTPDPGIASNPEQLLGLAQHYGIPTRLLDWTETPYVAAFFAFSGIASSPDREHRIAIWCLDTNSRIWGEDTGIKLLSIPSPYNERLKNQLGKFTLLQSPFDSVEEHIEKCDTTGTALQKITLPASEARTALSDLDFMGINYSTIYPGLDGCARAASLRMLLEQ